MHHSSASEQCSVFGWMPNEDFHLEETRLSISGKMLSLSRLPKIVWRTHGALIASAPVDIGSWHPNSSAVLMLVSHRQVSETEDETMTERIRVYIGSVSGWMPNTAIHVEELRLSIWKKHGYPCGRNTAIHKEETQLVGCPKSVEGGLLPSSFAIIGVAIWTLSAIPRTSGPPDALLSLPRDGSW